jgi:hypothetical protein
MSGSGDYISREAAIVASIYTSPMMPSQWLPIQHAIEAIPAADVRPVVRGKWIYDCDRTMHDGWIYKQYHCSLCEFQMIGGIHNFCPNCGADMREETDGT